MSTPGDPYGPTQGSPQPPPYGGQPGYSGQPGYGYGGQPQYGYGQPPGHGAPGPAWGGGPAPAEPPTVRTAFLLWIGAIGAYVLGQLLAVLLPPSTEEYAAYFESLGLPPEAQAEALSSMEATMGIASIAGLVVTVAFGALFAWFGLRMRAGAGWARITTAVLAGLGVLGALAGGLTSLVASVPVGGGAFGSVLQLLAAALLVGFLVFLFQRPSNEYFAAHAVRV